MEIRLTIRTEQADKLKKAFGESVQIRNMRSTDRKVHAYISDALPSTLLEIYDALGDTDILNHQTGRQGRVGPSCG